MEPTTAVRFMLKVEVSDHCWTWTGATAGVGYGVFWVPESGMSYAHRASYALFVGPVEEGLELDHLCSNRLCVNPTHLEAVTHAENCRRARLRGELDHCNAGHPFDEINTYVSPKGYRTCRICDRQRRVVRRFVKTKKELVLAQ